MFTGTVPRSYSMFPDLDTDGDSREKILSEYYKKVPELRKSARRAKALRGQRDKFEAMRDKEMPLGAVSEGSHGGLYSIQGSYIPNYSGMGDRIVGALGTYAADRKGSPLEKAEEGFDQLLGEETIGKYDLLGRRAQAREAARRKAAFSGIPQYDELDDLGF